MSQCNFHLSLVLLSFCNENIELPSTLCNTCGTFINRVGEASFPQLIQVNQYLPISGETLDTEGNRCFFCRGKCKQSLTSYMQFNQYVTFCTPAQTNGADYKVGRVKFFCRFGGVLFQKLVYVSTNAWKTYPLPTAI